MKRFTPILVVLLVVILFTGYFYLQGRSDQTTGTVTVGSKNFTENIVLGEIMAQLIEARTDLKVERKLNLGGTLVNFNALKKGDLDLYPDYTGTGLIAILKREVVNDPQEVYDIVQEEYNKKFKIKWLGPFGFNNTYAMAIRQEDAEKFGLRTTSDLQKVDERWVLGAEQEFFNRPDGYDGLVKAYGLKFKDTKALETGLKYQAMAQKTFDVTDAFTTDGQLLTYKLQVLEDDKGFFPPYFAAPVVRMDTLKKFPRLEETLNLLVGKISDEKMQQLNYLVEEKGESVEKVARDFLTEIGLIE